jgi:hypothetical protein
MSLEQSMIFANVSFYIHPLIADAFKVGSTVFGCSVLNNIRHKRKLSASCSQGVVILQISSLLKTHGAKKQFALDGFVSHYIHPIDDTASVRFLEFFAQHLMVSALVSWTLETTPPNCALDRMFVSRL